MTPYETFYKHRDLIKLVIEHEYLPHASAGNFGEVKAALQQIDGIKRDSTCSACMNEIIRMANVYLQSYMNSTFRTFPKQ